MLCSFLSRSGLSGWNEAIQLGSVGFVGNMGSYPISDSGMPWSELECQTTSDRPLTHDDFLHVQPTTDATEDDDFVSSFQPRSTANMTNLPAKDDDL